jgi:two-component system cell cycle sensor histidine kinase/response regulator CckA
VCTTYCKSHNNVSPIFVQAGIVYHDKEDQMKDPSGKYQKLIDENALLKQRIQELEQSESGLKRAEQALQDSEKRYRRLFESAKDGILILDAYTGKVVDVNPFLMRLLGYSYDALCGKHIWEIGVFKDIAASKDAFKALQDNEYIRYEDLPLETLDGKPIAVEFVSNVYLVDHTKVIQCNIRDITENKRMEEELLQAHKLESLGVLAGGIAHDFNNLMAIVQGYIDLALLDLPPDHASRKRLLTAMRSVDQTKDLTSRLITFSQGGGPIREICNVAEIVRDAVCRTLKGTDVGVKFDFMENLWSVKVDKLQMKQVFCSLTTNTLEAMPEGGNFTIQAENALIPAGEVPALKEGPYLKLTFTDEGVGIPEAHLSKVFDPYFTTKGMGAQKGMGLGLSVCYSVLKKHDGHITVKSQPGKGSSFVLYLPAQTDMAKEKEVKKLLSPGTVRVLIMDDEPHILEIERIYLERMGYEVTDARDGQEAIDAYRNAIQSGTPFDLVLLDLTVRQGLGGQAAMERMLKIDPSIKAIIASGFVDDPVIENFANYGFQGALKKPFKREEMKSLVEKILRQAMNRHIDGMLRFENHQQG